MPSLNVFLSVALGWLVVFPGPPGAVSFPVSPKKPKPVVLTLEDRGKTVAVPLGTRVTIELEGRPGTGYGWSLLSGDTSVLKPLGKPKNVIPKPERKLDGIELTVFRFKAVRKQSCTLEFVYRRPWEKDVPPAESALFDLVVGGAGGNTP